MQSAECIGLEYPNLQFGIASAWMNVISGVPQGSVLGPLLFVLFINDIVDSMDCQCYLYADDMKLYRIVKNDTETEILQTNLTKVVDWTEKWLLKLNVSKCKVLRINDKKIANDTGYEITENSVSSRLEVVESERDLGITIDSQLNFGSHIDYR